MSCARVSFGGSRDGCCDPREPVVTRTDFIPSRRGKPSAPVSGEYSNVALKSWIHLETVAKLPAKSRDLDSVAGSQAAKVNTRGCSDKGMHFSATIIDKYYEGRRQIILYGLRNRARYPDEHALGLFAYVSSGDGKGFDFRSLAMNFGFGYIDQN